MAVDLRYGVHVSGYLFNLGSDIFMWSVLSFFVTQYTLKE